MSIHPLASQPAPKDVLIDVDALRAAYHDIAPDPENPAQKVAFGTSGHRGSALNGSFNEAHIVAVARAVLDYRESRGFTGPLYIGIDSHALSEPAMRTAVEVFVAGGAEIRVSAGGALTPTPLVSRAIIAYNRGRASGFADGVVVTPSHNPPGDGGFKYNPPHGGPADSPVTDWIEDRANAYLAKANRGAVRTPYESARSAANFAEHDFILPYVLDLSKVLNLAPVRSSGLAIGVDPLGGSSLPVWDAVAEVHGLNLTVVNRTIDPTFGFMRLDHDGQIRMDCSSPYAMAGLVALKDDFDLAVACDPDADRHGIVARSAGLMNPNHYLCAAVDYLLTNRPDWPAAAAVGKTVVTTALIDRLAAQFGRAVLEVPVGFKWFVEPLSGARAVFGGEESAGASFLEKKGAAWTTDKDGILLALLAAEMTAVSGEDPARRYETIASRLGRPVYERRDAPASREQKKALARLSPGDIASDSLAGEKVLAVLSRAPGNDQAIGGIKVVAESGWFAARPSGTEDVYKIYAESFSGREHLDRLLAEAKAVVDKALGAAG
jgi:phosphoglucomutase